MALLGYFETVPAARILYHHMPPIGAPDEGRIRVVGSGYPETWLHTYIRQKRFRCDPVALHAVSAELPFATADIRRLRDLSDDEAALQDEIDRLELSHGVAIPAFGPGGRNGYFGIGYAAGTPLPRQIDLAEQAWVCQHAHLYYCRMVRKQLPETPQLSRREQQILGWVARGKSNGVIAEIMDLSPHTVDAHIRRVFLKLGTSDRVSAAVRGIGEGIIQGH